jgi:endonuclease YncB( thermonuclease family)
VGSHRLITAGAALVVCVTAGCSSDTGGASGDARPETATVSWIVDGDTLRLRDGRRVRLVQIDAPEVGECFHDGATQALRRLLPLGTRVALARDPRLDDRDDYGRLLRYVEQGTIEVNLALVETGAAAPYFFRGDRGRLAGRLLAAAKEARTAPARGSTPAAAPSPAGRRVRPPA